MERLLKTAVYKLMEGALQLLSWVGYMLAYAFEEFKTRAGCATDKEHQVIINNIMLFKTVIPLRN